MAERDASTKKHFTDRRTHMEIFVTMVYYLVLGVPLIA
jgi:hypothetical protein